MDSYEFSISQQMPASYHQDDDKWIREMLLKLDPTTRVKISHKYSEVYEHSRDTEPVSFRKDNRARHHANTRLRIFVDKYSPYSKGAVSEPEVLLGTCQ
ncbi:hypothetical protein AI29_09985 [bacteria symbiont BFo2 of Frankliniella occidentalis]|nr:hypothetical protein AI29_09985 [bacteria symbiont BFo2 of Frankliniella occidentalis]